jgi:CHAT domain-containing protein
MSIRIATAEAHLGHPHLANVAMAEARCRAGAVADSALRAKLLADVDAAEGSLTRSEPARALTLLSSAISFEEMAGRAIVLPVLYLERGRCFVALRRDADASRDFEAGIAALERQRSRTAAIELRPGIFDDASDLFEEAVLLALRRGAPTDAFDYVERGRARAVLEEIAARSPDKGSAVRSVGTVMRVLGPNDLLLEYAALQDRLVIFAIDSTQCTFVVSPRPRLVDRLDAQSMISALASRRSWEQIQPISARLYDAFLGQMRTRLATKRNVVIVGDASMQQLPYAALYDRATARFMIEDHSIVAAPSAAVYALSARRQLTEPASAPSAAIFANPLPHAAPFEALAPLPASEAEGRSVAHAYTKAHLALRDQATVSAFRNVASSFDVVHFAGHAVLYPAEPWRSALVFASSGHDDGTLSVEEVAQLRFTRTRIVILAACSTLRAQKGGIEGVPSLARAFLVSGVPSVVGTLADVDDFEAATLLSRLHENIRRGVAPADALRASQLAVLHGDDPALRHPGYWSAFALLGAGFGR